MTCLLPTFMLAIKQSIASAARRRNAVAFHLFRPLSTVTKPSGQPAEDDSVIPNEPTWSVHELISSYPRPSISDPTFKKLHDLSALIPPEEGSSEYARLKHELEEMVRLVDAVRLVDTSSAVPNEGSIPDGRIRNANKGMKLATNTRDVEFDDPETEWGTELLKHACRTKNGYYVVEAERRKK